MSWVVVKWDADKMIGTVRDQNTQEERPITRGLLRGIEFNERAGWRFSVSTYRGNTPRIRVGDSVVVRFCDDARSPNGLAVYGWAPTWWCIRRRRRDLR